MERRVKASGDRDLLTCEVGRARPQTVSGDGCVHAHARTNLSGAESSLPSHVAARVTLRPALGAHSLSHSTPDAPTRNRKAGFFWPLENRKRPARRQQPKLKEEDCGTSTGDRAVS